MKIFGNWGALLVAFALGIVTVHAADRVEIWVSPSGDDQNAGTQAAPVVTLVRAQALERAALTQVPKPAVTVWLNPGVYPVAAGWTFGAQDSGSVEAPVVWRGTQAGKARLLGCRPIPAEKWSLLQDATLQDRLAPEAKGKVKEIDFASAGIGAVAAFPDFSHETALPIQLFCRDEALSLSRWPAGKYGYSTMQTVLDNGGKRDGDPHGGVFVYRDAEPTRWLAALEDEGVWVRGFWRVPWEASTLRVKAIDTTSNTITLAASLAGGIGSKYGRLQNGVRIGNGKEKWCALNLLEEITAPGEWSIDFKRGKIYLWPASEDVVSFSDNTGPLVSVAGASNLEFRQIVLGWNVGSGFKIAGGAHVTVAACELREVAGVGFQIAGGTEHSLLGNDIYDVGLSAIDVSGGDRATLKPCKDEIDNNLLVNVANRAPMPAIVAGLNAGHQNVVGIHVAHNRIDGASYGGITFGGNDNLFEYNDIYRIGLDGGDLGGFYTTGGWTSRGNIVRYNFIHDAANANGIYMDDGDSGLLAYGNLIYKVNSAILIGGGHDNIIRNNLIVKTERGFHIDDRGVSRHYTADDPRLRGDYNSMPVSSDIWRKEYPGLADFLKNDPSLPSGNIIEKNILVACGAAVRKSGKAENLIGYQLAENVELPSLDIFNDVAKLDFALKDPGTFTSAITGFEQIPAANMGLVLDANRTVVPQRNLDELNAASQKNNFDSQQDVDSSRKTR